MGASVATLSCITELGRRNSHGFAGMESTLILVPPLAWRPSLSYDMFSHSGGLCSVLEHSSHQVAVFGSCRLVWKDSLEGDKAKRKERSVAEKSHAKKCLRGHCVFFQKRPCGAEGAVVPSALADGMGRRML